MADLLKAAIKDKSMCNDTELAHLDFLSSKHKLLWLFQIIIHEPFVFNNIADKIFHNNVHTLVFKLVKYPGGAFFACLFIILNIY